MKFLDDCDNRGREGDEDRSSILLSNDIKPKSVNYPVHVEVIRRRLTTLVKEVREGTGNVSEKQKMLDFIEEIRLESGNRNPGQVPATPKITLKRTLIGGHTMGFGCCIVRVCRRVSGG